MTEVSDENVMKAEPKKEQKLSKKKVKEAISILKQLNEKYHEEKSKKSLLEDGSESTVYLQVTLKKIPPAKLKRNIKVHLPHSLMTDTTEVCLITGDLEKNNKKAEIEPTVLHYKELLKKYGVTGITEVVPLRQLRTEYKTYESKRQLSAAYDMFLSDKKISGCLPKVLGKAFYDKRKIPIQINLNSSLLKEQIERAVSETSFFFTCRGNSCTTEVARLSMENDEIMENILKSSENIAEQIPKKWSNVLGLYIKTAKSEAIPIYMSFENANDWKIKAPNKVKKPEAGELSTLRNVEVKVYKDGKIVTTDLPDSEDEDNEDSPVEKTKHKKRKNKEDTNRPDTEDEGNEASVKKTKNKKRKTKEATNLSDNENEGNEDSPVKKTKNKKRKNKEATDLPDNEDESNEDSPVKKTMKRKRKNEEATNLPDSEDEGNEDFPVKKTKNKKRKNEEATNLPDSEDEGNEEATNLHDSDDAANRVSPVKKTKSKKKKNKDLVNNTSGDQEKEEDSSLLEPKIKRKKTKTVTDKNKEHVNETAVEEKKKRSKKSKVDNAGKKAK